MFIFIIISSCLFLGIMIPTIMISLFHGTTVKLLEALKFYKKGSLFADERTYATGAGYHRTGTVYVTKMPDGDENFETGKIFGFMMLTFGTIFLVIGIVLIITLKLLQII
jgi:hypothetical protein